MAERKVEKLLPVRLVLPAVDALVGMSIKNLEKLADDLGLAKGKVRYGKGHCATKQSLVTFILEHQASAHGRNARVPLNTRDNLLEPRRTDAPSLGDVCNCYCAKVDCGTQFDSAVNPSIGYNTRAGGGVFTPSEELMSRVPGDFRAFDLAAAARDTFGISFSPCAL